MSRTVTQQANSAASQFIYAARQSERLSRETEAQLLHRYYKHGDRAAVDRLVRAHLRYVVTIALKYRRYGLPLADLIAEGNFGIVHALSKFEPERGNRFVTYAVYWIRAYVLNHVIRSWSLVGVGSGALRSKMFFKLRRERVRLLNQLGDESQADELLAQKLKLSPAKLRTMLGRLEARDVSLDSRLFGESESTLLDRLVEPGDSQETSVIADEVSLLRRQAVRQAICILDERERYIVQKRLMADPEEELSLAQIGRTLGVSRERARQLEARAKRKLRSELLQKPFKREARIESAA